MPDTFAVSALTRKRARIAGDIEQAEAALAAKRETLANLDAVIRLFPPGANPELIPSVRAPTRRGLFFKYGEQTRLCFDALREAGKPASTRQIAGHLIAVKGFENEERRVRNAIVIQVRQALIRMERRGQVRRVLAGPEAWWELSKD